MAKKPKKSRHALNRSLSIRSAKSQKNGSSGTKYHAFSLNSLRGGMQPELSKKLYKLIKDENHLIASYESAGKERISIATQLSDWGEATGDDAISDISDKIGVLLSEIGEQEDLYAHNLDESRTLLKSIRNVEKSVQPSRDHKAKIQDEIAKLRVKEPESTKLPTLEQELVRAEAENLVAEAQLTNTSRQKMKEAYAEEFYATIERAEKQMILAKHGLRLLSLLDDTPVVPGTVRPAYDNTAAGRQILNEAEDDLRSWSPTHEQVHTAVDDLETNLMPSARQEEPTSTGGEAGELGIQGGESSHLSRATDNDSYEHEGTVGTEGSVAGTSVTTGAGPTYAASEAETPQVA